MKTKKHKVKTEDAWMDHVRILENGLITAETDLSFERVRLGYMDNDVLIENQKHDIAIMEDNISDTKKMIDGIIKTNTKPIKKPLPKTWEEYFRKNGDREFGRSVFIQNKYRHAFEALSKLIRLRDVYNDGWVADYKKDTVKPSILIEKNKIITANVWFASVVLAFRTEALRNEFLSNFRDLIETAKPLL